MFTFYEQAVSINAQPPKWEFRTSCWCTTTFLSTRNTPILHHRKGRVAFGGTRTSSIPYNLFIQQTIPRLLQNRYTDTSFQQQIENEINKKAKHEGYHRGNCLFFNQFDPRSSFKACNSSGGICHLEGIPGRHAGSSVICISYNGRFPCCDDIESPTTPSSHAFPPCSILRANSANQTTG